MSQASADFSTASSVTDNHIEELRAVHQMQGSVFDMNQSHTFLENVGCIRSYSMEVMNDPRFFTSNVLILRITAFGTLATLSGIFVSFSQGDVFDADKRMELRQADGSYDIDGILQLVRYVVNVVIWYTNIMGIYVGVAQPYHVYRLMTAGPNGFDASAGYYLNKNMTLWRHFAVKGMFLSMPWYVFSKALTMAVQFDRRNYMDGVNPPPLTHIPEDAEWEMWVFAGIAFFLTLLVSFVHIVHNRVFNEKYHAALHYSHHMMRHVGDTSRARGENTYLDV